VGWSCGVCHEGGQEWYIFNGSKYHHECLVIIPKHSEFTKELSLDIPNEVYPVINRLHNRAYNSIKDAQAPDRQQIEHNTTVQRWERIVELAEELLEVLDEGDEHL